MFLVLGRNHLRSRCRSQRSVCSQLRIENAQPFNEALNLFQLRHSERVGTRQGPTDPVVTRLAPRTFNRKPMAVRHDDGRRQRSGSDFTAAPVFKEPALNRALQHVRHSTVLVINDDLNPLTRARYG
jgi:hypothetical protein